MRPAIVCSTLTLAILSKLISMVFRLMKPVLWTTRMLVTSVSVVQRWNQAVTVQYSATTADTAASARQSSTGVSAATMRDATRNATVTIHAAMAGRKNIQCALVEYSTF